MPSRVIREGILTSERVNSLSCQGELFYRRLLSVIDDYGRFDARPSLLRVSCFPLKVDLTPESDVSSWLFECEQKDLLGIYEVAGKPYLQVFDFRQQKRSRSKWPEPPPDLLSRCLSTDSTCAADDERPCTKAESDSDSESNANSEAKAKKKRPPARSAAEGSQRSWKTDFSLYMLDAETGFDKLMGDWAWIAEKKRFYPGCSIRRSIEKMWSEFWGKQSGWQHKRKKGAESIDWERTIENGLSERRNRVYYGRNEKDDEAQIIAAKLASGELK